MERTGGFLSIHIRHIRYGPESGNEFLLPRSPNMLNGLSNIRKSSEMIVYSYYILDIIHKGHLHYMQIAKAIASENGLSIVGILTDEAVMEKKPHPTLSFEERLDLAAAIRFNDVVVVQETYSPLPNLKLLCPDAVLESSSHDSKDIEKVKIFMHSINSKVFVIPYYSVQSSTKIKESVRKNEA